MSISRVFSWKMEKFSPLHSAQCSRLCAFWSVEKLILEDSINATGHPFFFRIKISILVQFHVDVVCVTSNWLNRIINRKQTCRIKVSVQKRRVIIIIKKLGKSRRFVSCLAQHRAISIERIKMDFFFKLPTKRECVREEKIRYYLYFFPFSIFLSY